MDCNRLVDSLPAEPGSVRTVMTTLCRHGRLTTKEVQERSGLARRTVYGAVRRLRELGYLVQVPNLRDTRQSWLVLRVPEASA